MKTPTIQVYFNNGSNAVKPWHVGLRNGRAIDEHYGNFRTPIEAIRYALDTVSENLDLPVLWPNDLKVVIN